MLPLIERPFDDEEQREMVSDFLFPSSSAPKIVLQIIRAHASNVVSLGSWERGDTMRNLQTVSIDHFDYEPTEKCLQPDIVHRVLVAGVCKSKELLGDTQRVSTWKCVYMSERIIQMPSELLLMSPTK